MLPRNDLDYVHDWIYCTRENHQEIRLFQRNVYHLGIKTIHQFFDFLFG